MYRKCLIAIGTVVLCMGTLYAHPNWGVTVIDGQYEWAKKTAAVSVELRIPPAAEISAEGQLVLEPFDGAQDDYRGLLDLTLHNNFRNLQIRAVIDPVPPTGIWTVRLRDLDPGGQLSSPGLTTELVVPNLHLRNNPGTVRVVVRARNIDLMSAYTPGATVTTVKITMSLPNGTQVGSTTPIGVTNG